jgi:hypothetical protein
LIIGIPRERGRFSTRDHSLPCTSFRFNSRRDRSQPEIGPKLSRLSEELRKPRKGEPTNPEFSQDLSRKIRKNNGRSGHKCFADKDKKKLAAMRICCKFFARNRLGNSPTHHRCHCHRLPTVHQRSWSPDENSDSWGLAASFGQSFLAQPTTTGRPSRKADRMPRNRTRRH